MAKHMMHTAMECTAEDFCPVVPYDIKRWEYFDLEPWEVELLQGGGRHHEETRWPSPVYFNGDGWARFGVYGPDRYL